MSNDHTQERNETPRGPTFFPDKTLADWIERCDPFQPLDSAKDKRYVDLGFVEEDGHKVPLRGDDHIEHMYDKVVLSNRQSSQLFTGFSGTGKSTELSRLKHRLEDKGFTVLLADAQNYHDLNHTLTLEDLTIVVAAAFGEATTEIVGHDVIPESYWQRLQTFLQQEVTLGDAKLPAGPIDLKIGIKHERPFWLKIRDVLSLAPSKLQEHNHGFITRCVTHLREKDPETQGVVFILDSLEKLYAPIPEFHKVMTSLVRVFSDFPQHFHLPDCHTIYTIPPYVQLMNPNLGDRFRVSEVLPAVKVVERDLEDVTRPFRPYRPGIDRLTELIDKRIPIDQVFGSRRDLLDDLIVNSGGHICTLLRSTTELLFLARRNGLPPTEDMISRILSSLRQKFEILTNRGSYPVLARILEQKPPFHDDDDRHRAGLARLAEYGVLIYPGGRHYEVHPLMYETAARLVRDRQSQEAA